MNNVLLALVSLLLALSVSPIAAGQRALLKIVVIEGEDAVNIIQQKTAVTPLVEVRDENNQPVAGAIVRFAIRNGRASFNGARTLSVATNAAGRATAVGFTPSGTGALQIGATAAYQGQTATVTIAQTNVLTAAQAAAATGASSGAGASTATGAAAAAGGGAAATVGTTAAAAGGGAGAAGGISATTIAVASGAAAGGTLVAVKASSNSGSAQEFGPESGDYAGSLTLAAVRTVRSPGLVGQPGAIGDTCTWNTTLAITVLVVIDTDLKGSVTEGHVETRWTETETSRSCPNTTPIGGSFSQFDDLDGQPANGLHASRIETANVGGGTVSTTTTFAGSVSGSTVVGSFSYARSGTVGAAVETTPTVSGTVTLQRVAQ